MSVFYEARISGRLASTTWSPQTVPRGINGTRMALSCKGIRRALQTAKRFEAEERNTKTPHYRTAAARREAAESIARFEAKKARS